MEALRFGADAVFRTQEVRRGLTVTGAEVTDEDVDAILARGEAKTAELNAKLQKMEKGDLLDFRLDGGMAVQTFEGTDFSDKANRQLMEPMYIDTGKRNRKPVDAQLAAAIAASIGTTSAAAAAAAAKRKIPRLPSPLGLPTMHDWQFYDKARINELQSVALLSSSLDMHTSTSHHHEQQAAVDKLTAMRESGADVPYETDVLERTLFSPQLRQAAHCTSASMCQLLNPAARMQQRGVSCYQRAMLTGAHALALGSLLTLVLCMAAKLPSFLGAVTQPVSATFVHCSSTYTDSC
eukprot:13654-Heterococcus_DN1.PRE.1